MSYVQNRYGPKLAIEQTPWRPSKLVITAFIMGLAALGSFVAITTKPYDGRRIAAAAFVWPAGCPARGYEPGNRLPRACFDRFQELSPEWARAHRLKIHQTARTSYYSYYRLGNDAVSPLCIAWEKSCTISWVYRGLFVVDPTVTNSTSMGWRTLPPAKDPR
jgi:hypothetical protein